MEQCGMRSDVAKIWDDAIALAEGTEFLANVYFAWAVSLYNRAEYAKALKLIDKSLEHYKCYNLEPSIFDETKASILCYRSICLSQEIRYSEAILDIQHAIELWPDHSASSYNLYYNLGYYYLGNHEWSNAKEALDVIKAMPLDKLQKQQVEELYAILRIPLKDRMRYVQSYFGDNFT
jgi:tetratricopeptide (TPR) repeat protein